MVCMYSVIQFLKNNPVFREYHAFSIAFCQFGYNLNRYNMKSEGNCIISAVTDMTGKENNLALLYADAQLVSFHKRLH